MKLWKKPYLLLMVISSCFALLSSCSTSTTGSPATPTPSGRTPTATSTALPTSWPTNPPSTCGVWSRVSSPNVGTSTNFLHGVAASSMNDVWAVGSSSDDQHGSLTLVEHWNGTQWNVAARGPRPGLFTNELYSIAASSANDVWAIGSAYGLTPSSPYYPLIEHWNRSQWSIVKIPLPGYAAGLSSITVTSASDIWAVGDYEKEPGEPAPSFTLIEHWNGSTWSVVNSPSPGSFGNDLVAAVWVPATRSIWAVGSTEHLNIGRTFQTLTELYC